MIKNGCIYLITNLINGRKYVGQTRYTDPQKRWKTHMKSAKNGSPYKLHNAIRKYGQENFLVETIRICKHEELGSLEEYYAEIYGTYMWDPSEGYNMTWCGKNFRLGMSHTEETREKLRTSHLGKKASVETREKMAIAQKGKKRSEECCKNIKQGKLNNPISPEGLKSLISYNTGRKMSEKARANMKKAHQNIKDKSISDTKEVKEFPCTHVGCNKVLPKKASLKLHLRTHSGEKPFVCKECDKGFACGSNLDMHMISHSKDKTHKCTDCDRMFKYERTMKDHIKKLHREAPKQEPAK